MIDSTERKEIADLLGVLTIQLQSIAGGDISDAFLVETDHEKYFLKLNTSKNAASLFEAELKGLKRLSQHCHTPRVIKSGNFKSGNGSFLILAFIESGAKDQNFWIDFGQSLAKLHLVSNSKFGLDHNNFIGRLPQTNEEKATWAEFYATQRLIPQVKLAFDNNMLPATLLPRFDQLYNSLDNLCPIEKPRLIHGDLWSGNFIASKNQQAFFIDPSVSFSHREMDMAMTRLFGGFHESFYESYNNTLPLEQYFEERIYLYQLYYLLAHLNMFGTSYFNAVKQAVLKYT